MSSLRQDVTAAIVASGDELMTGRRVDTNSSAIQTYLRRLGIRVVECRQVGDEEGEICRCLKEAVQVASIVVTTGGLGPTEDDRMRAAVASAAGVELQHSAEAEATIREFFARLGRPASPSNSRQALIPGGGRVLKNESGTAPGFEIEVGQATLFALPGVPREMHWMMKNRVLPALRTRFEEAPYEHELLQVVGLPESVLGEKIESWMDERSLPSVGVTAHIGVITISIADRANEEGRSRLLRCVEELRTTLGRAIFSRGETTLEEHVVEALRQSGSTVAVAESCTGGMIGSWLTRVAGASEVFLEGCITYSNAAKERTLKVPAAILEQHGAVSEETARAMAEGVRARAGTTYGLSVTGIAGPGGGSPDKPVGRVHVAVATPGETHHRRLDLRGDRHVVRRRASVSALDLLRRQLPVDDAKGPALDPPASTGGD